MGGPERCSTHARRGGWRVALFALPSSGHRSRRTRGRGAAARRCSPTLGVESPPFAQLAAWWLFEMDAMDDDQRELFEERATVREYEAGFPRGVAELLALADVLLARLAGAESDTEPADSAIMEAA